MPERQLNDLKAVCLDLRTVDLRMVDLGAIDLKAVCHTSDLKAMCR
jgi:hypothetical protein